MSLKAWTAGLVGVLAFTPTAWAQVPGIPPAAGAGLGGLGGAGAGLGGLGGAGAAAAPMTIWGKLGISHENLAACKLKICRGPLGPLIGSMTAGPLGAVSGGLLSNCCPPPTAAEIAALEARGGAQGAAAVAAKIQADEADAKARVVAVEYLGTVDCRYWKEAQVALLNALRADRNECVRYAAARAFNNGCCCSKEVIESLRIVVAGEDSDGFPAEPSARVRGTAFAALQNCLMKVQANLPPEPLEPERGPGTAPPPAPGIQPERAAGLPTLPSDLAPNAPAHVAAGLQTPMPALSPVPGQGTAAAPARPLSVFEARVRNKTFAGTVDEAKRTLFVLAQSAPKSVNSPLPPGKQSVLHAVTKARQDVAEAARQKAVQAPAPRAEAAPASAPLPPLSPTPSAAATRAKGADDRTTFPAPAAPVVPASYWGTKPSAETGKTPPSRRGLARLLPSRP